jgi:hypothetical protein
MGTIMNITNKQHTNTIVGIIQYIEIGNSVLVNNATK